MRTDRTLAPLRCSRRTLLRVAGAAGMAALLPTAVPAQSPAPTAGSPGSGPAVTLLLPRPTGDAGAVDDLASAMERARRDLGVRGTIVTVTEPGAWAGTLDRLAQGGERVIVAAFPELASAVGAAARAHPGTRFIHVDGDPSAPSLPNLATIAMDAYLGWHLAGILAGDVSPVRQVGYVGALADDAHHAAANAFRRAATASAPDVVVDTGFVTNPGDAAFGVDLAVEQLGLGADIIAADAGPSDPVIVATAAQTGTFAIVGSEDLAAAHPATVLATVVVQRGQALVEALGPALEPAWDAASRRAGIADGLVDLVANEAFLDAGPGALAVRVSQALDLVNEERAAIVSGRRIPARDTTAPPA